MKDNFSGQATGYARYRPQYPAELFDYILKHVVNRSHAWDCGTGNGQAARALAPYFEKVFATDISQKQLEQAYRAGNIFYSLQSSEQTDFLDDLFDLVTVSQALHWFRFDEFYKEVNRVTRPGAFIAAWAYSNLHIAPEIDELINVQHYKQLLGSYWDYERKFVDEHYQTIPFPFKEIKTPEFEIRVEWGLKELQGYLETWSALQKFIKINRYDPVLKLVENIRPYWAKEKMTVVFPLHLRLGQVEK